VLNPDERVEYYNDVAGHQRKAWRYFAVAILAPLFAALLSSFAGESWISLSLYTGFMLTWAICFYMARRHFRQHRLNITATIENDFLALSTKFYREGLVRMIYFAPCDPVGWKQKVQVKFLGYRFLCAYQRIDLVDDGALDRTSSLRFKVTEKELFELKLKGYYNTEDIEIALRGFQSDFFHDRSRMDLV